MHHAKNAGSTHLHSQNKIYFNLLQSPSSFFSHFPFENQFFSLFLNSFHIPCFPLCNFSCISSPFLQTLMPLILIGSIFFYFCFIFISFYFVMYGFYCYISFLIYLDSYNIYLNIFVINYHSKYIKSFKI